MEDNLIKNVIYKINTKNNINNKNLNIVENLNNNNNNKNKKRVIAKKWNFSDDNYNYDNQIKFIKEIHSNTYDENNKVMKIVIQEINRKISSYKQQDKIKKLFDEPFFLTFDSIINKMIECQLKCKYCLNEMNVLYDISREIKQWSVDRIDNNLGHNINNFHLACLECNLKRRRRSDEKFLFTKQLKIVKTE
jgi:hypothetical protein